MTDKNLTEIIAIVDRSGSMGIIANDARGGFNEFLRKQQEDTSGECLLTYVHFDHEYEVVHEGINIKDMKPLNEETYCPRGGTALLDAVGRTIATVGERLSKTPEEKRPANVVVVILTDGEENSSAEYSNAQIRSMVDHQTEKYDWGFVYLAQNMDAFAEGSKMGFVQSNPKHFLGNIGAGGGAMRAAYCCASEAVSGRRMKAASSVSMDWAAEEKEDYSELLSTDNSSDLADSSTE